MEKKFKVGDRVKVRTNSIERFLHGASGTIIHDDNNPPANYLVEFDEVRPLLHSGHGLGKDSRCWWLDNSDLEKIEKSETPKFKVGDRVIANGSVDGIQFKNDHGKVIKHYSGDCYCIEFDRNIGGHDAMGSGKPEYCWWIDAKFLQLEVEPTEPKFKIGDRVTPITGDHVGKLATYKGTNGTSSLLEFDENIDGHGGYPPYTGKDEHCWWFPIDEVRLVEEHVTIYRVGQKVIAEDNLTGKTAVAKCHEDDTFDFKIGAKLAVERLFEEPPKYYNAKVVCVGNTANPTRFTVGKIYEFVDGYLIDNHGEEAPRVCKPIKSLKEWDETGCLARFIEVIE